MGGDELGWMELGRSGVGGEVSCLGVGLEVGANVNALPIAPSSYLMITAAAAATAVTVSVTLVIIVALLLLFCGCMQSTFQTSKQTRYQRRQRRASSSAAAAAATAVAVIMILVAVVVAIIQQPRHVLEIDLRHCRHRVVRGRVLVHMSLLPAPRDTPATTTANEVVVVAVASGPDMECIGIHTVMLPCHHAYRR